MNTAAKKQYLENPCRAASIPYWKSVMYEGIVTGIDFALFFGTLIKSSLKD